MVPAAPHELRKISNNVCSRNVLDAFMATRCICNVLVGFRCTSCTSDMIQNNSVALTMFRRPSGLKHDKKTINGWLCKTIMSLYLQRANPNTWRRRGTPIPSYTTPKKTYISFNDFLEKKLGNTLFWVWGDLSRRSEEEGGEQWLEYLNEITNN
jgi:hypothetical protein